MSRQPLLSGIVVHWHDEDLLAELVRAWPRDSRFELLVVDNGSRQPMEQEPARIVRPHANLGFAGGVNLGITLSRAPVVLLLNPDASPREGALEALIEGFRRHPDAAGLAPRLEGPEGEPQHRWQLRPLPPPWSLLMHTWLLPGARGPRGEPAAGAAVEQPAGAALALRKEILQEMGGLDETYYPAWFEDVDLARRLRNAGWKLRYWPASRFRHRLGSSLATLGYDRFLWAYYRNLERYLSKHHGQRWMLAARVLLPFGMLGRLLLLPLRRPRRARTRWQAAGGLLAVGLGALSGWRLPRLYAEQTEIRPGCGSPEPTGGREADPR